MEQQTALKDEEHDRDKCEERLRCRRSKEVLLEIREEMRGWREEWSGWKERMKQEMEEIKEWLQKFQVRGNRWVRKRRKRGELLV